MTVNTLGLILLSVCLSALAQISFKFGISSLPLSTGERASPLLVLARALLTPGVLGGLALYGLGTLIWLMVLKRIEVSQAYPFIGLGIMLTGLLGYMLFGESLGFQRILGMFLVTSGIILVACS